MPSSIESLGDWIRVKRREKNIKRYHLAIRLGIATKLLRSWEFNLSQPDRQQLEHLVKKLKIVITPAF